MKSVSIYFSLRTTQFQARRNSGFSGMFVTAVENPVEQESEMLPQGPQETPGSIRERRERSRRQRKNRDPDRSRWIRLDLPVNEPKKHSAIRYTGWESLTGMQAEGIFPILIVIKGKRKKNPKIVGQLEGSRKVFTKVYECRVCRSPD